ncbi:MAG: manganese efflux pump MntP family protein [Thermodesulfobacteriota bacterium]
MSLYEILAVAVALAMDAFAVSCATGCSLERVGNGRALRMAAVFGGLQALMPVIGWGAGLAVRDFVTGAAPWIAFGLLVWVGGKMLWEALHAEEGGERADNTRGLRLLALGVAVSIDALAVGLSLSLVQVSIWLPVAVIGLVAAGFTVLGLHLGCRVARATRLGVYAEILGGLVLIGIGVKVLAG